MGVTTDQGLAGKFPCIMKGVTTFLLLNDGSNHESPKFGANTSIIMVIIASLTASKGVFANIGVDPSTSSAIPSINGVMYLPNGTYYFAVNPGELFRAHQEDGTANVTVIEGA